MHRFQAYINCELDIQKPAPPCFTPGQDYDLDLEEKVMHFYFFHRMYRIRDVKKLMGCRRKDVIKALRIKSICSKWSHKIS